MARRRTHGEQLARWASERAPDLLARAADEAVAALRDALIEAAVGAARGRAGGAVGAGPGSDREVRHHAGPAAGWESGAGSQAGELLWVYCAMRASDAPPAGVSGVHGSAVERVEAAGLAAIVSPVPRAEFGPEPLRRNLNDLVWLERAARGHEAVLDAALGRSTIVPLRLCTLYESSQAVRDMLERERDMLEGALEALDGRLEWAVKVLADTDRLLAAVRASQAETAAPAEEPDVSGEGSAYMVRRREERRIRELADAMASEAVAGVHARLADWAADAVTRPPQNRELSGHRGEMLLNGAYLVERERTEELRRLVHELQAQHRHIGVRVELTGPWPPYNFVPGADAALA